ncbi:hypothetical protein DPMN_122700 [Dreissena polymorpha]|uniref:Uncharacterized protein n=1 Tax=Dreissena polymorpha TaxID=45954 RepID=A0A9D4GSD1_DREPO|nr:hypothetical protein DPMN_122700 [Dreissena polymorpha]
MKADGTTLEAFGYDAESKYAELAAEENHTDVYFFQTFKMKLFDNEGTIGNSTLLEDETGKKLKALTVFSLTIKYLIDDVMDFLNKQITNGVNKNDINWVLTVPAIRDDHAKQFMRTAAREAGIEIGHLSLALEPEAASIYCRHIKMSREENSTGADISTFQPDTRYLICDAGGKGYASDTLPVGRFDGQSVRIICCKFCGANSNSISRAITVKLKICHHSGDSMCKTLFYHQ